jgi:hypothetical protein
MPSANSQVEYRRSEFVLLDPVELEPPVPGIVAWADWIKSAVWESMPGMPIKTGNDACAALIRPGTVAVGTMVKLSNSLDA